MLPRDQTKPSAEVASFAKVSPEPIAATIAVEMIGPTPGTVIRRLHSALRLAIALISEDSALIAAVEVAPILGSPRMISIIRGKSLSLAARIRRSSKRKPPILVARAPF